MPTPQYYRKQADAPYAAARVRSDATERLALVLTAVEFEARGVDARRGAIPPAWVANPDPSVNNESTFV